MTNKLRTLVLVICLLLGILSPGLVQAQSGLTISYSSVEIEFPSQINFSISAESDVDITDIRLHYRVNQLSYAQVVSEVYIEFMPATTVDASWTWDMRRTGGLPTGASLEYWWTIEDAKMSQAETAPASIQFDDARYTWRSLTENMVTIYWYKGEESFAQELMAIAQQSLTRLAEDTGAYLEKPVEAYIYTSTEDLLGSMIFPQEWTGGVAFTRHGIIAIGIAPNNLDWGKSAMTHELTHLVIHQMTLNPYNDLPTWLDEGLAMYAEGAPGPQFTTLLSKAIDEGRLISVRSLSSPFSAYGEQATLSYAQSYSLVEFLISNHGSDKMLELLNTFRQGNSYNGALEKVYGFDMDSLNTLWQDYVTKQYRPTKVRAENIALMLVAAS